MKKLHILIMLFSQLCLLNQAFSQISWFADPNYVGFNYIGGLGVTEESSSWQPGEFRFYTDDNYDSGAFFIPTKLDFIEYGTVEGSSIRILASQATLEGNKLAFKDTFGDRIKMDYDELRYTNGASWPAFSVNVRGNSGQVDLYHGVSNNYLVRLGSSSENSNQGSLGLYDEFGVRKVRAQVDDFNEGIVQTYGANGSSTAILGSIFGSNDGALFISNDNGISNMSMQYDVNNKGVVTSNFYMGEKITIASDGSSHSGVFGGGKGVRIKSVGNSTPDLTLEANDVDGADGYISSDPNFNNSNLIFRSYGSVVFTLDTDGNTPGLNPFIVQDDNMAMRVSDDSGLIMQKISGGVDEPHIEIRDISSNSYGRLNIGNVDSQAWQIAGKPTGTSTQKYLLFHLTDPDGTTGNDLIQLRGDGNAFIEGVWAPISDIRLKKDIVKVENSLDKISKLNGYNYNWKDPKKPEPQTGVIAQEVQKVFPNLVLETAKGDLSVNYDGLIPHLIEAVKELQKEVEILKKGR